ncbi:MAG: hypothetical protein ACI4F4_02450 [Lachnospiraceae bacterium]
MYMQNVDLKKLFPEIPDCIKEEQRCQDDFEYFKKMYPAKLRLVASIIEEYLDQFEYEGSPIYVEYPDQVTIYRMTNRICDLYWNYNDKKNRKETQNEEDEAPDMKNRFKEMLYIMVCQEIYIRRRRKERYVRRFMI